MPSETVQLRNKATGQPHTIALSDLQSVLSTGNYETYEGSTVNTTRLDTPAAVDPLKAQGVLDTNNETFVDPNKIANEQTKKTQRESFDTMGNKALTFAEGVTDSLSFGLVRERGDEAELRREVNSGSAFSGEMAGIALGLLTGGGEAELARLGESAGMKAARLIFGNEGTIAKLGGRALSEAGANMAISAAQATGHQVWDSILENKPMAVEAITHEVGMAGLMGAGFGLLGGAFSSAARGVGREAVETGTNIPGFVKSAAETFDTSIGELRQAIRVHETRLGVLNHAAEEGILPVEFVAERAEKLALAQKAETRLANLGNADYALNASPRAAYAWQKALEDVHVKVGELDAVMTPKVAEPTHAITSQPIGPVTPTNNLPGEAPTTIPGATSEQLKIGDYIEYKGGGNKALNGPVSGLRTDPITGESVPMIKYPHGEEPIYDWKRLNHSNEPTMEIKLPDDMLTNVGKIPTPPPEVIQNGKAFNNTVDFDAHPELHGDNLLGGLKDLENQGKLDRQAKYNKLMDDWSEESKKFVTGSPGQKAVSAIDRHLGELNVQTGGKLDAVSSLDIARKNGFGEPNIEIGHRFQQAWSINKLAGDAAKASRVSTAEIAEGVTSGSSMLSRAKTYAGRRIVGKAGAAVGGALIGNELAGNEAGYYLGAALATGYMGFGGKVAGSIAKLSTKIAEVGDFLLKGRRSTIITQTLAKNNAWSYSDKGPIKDPIERIQEIHHVSSHPEMIAQQISNNSGDLGTVHPEMLDLLTKAAQGRMMALSVRAPKFMWDKFGQPMNPAAGDMRRFIEYENAVNDLNGTLDAFSKGNITKDSADGLKDGWPAFHNTLMTRVLKEPAYLAKLPPNSLRAVEHITGVDLTGITDGKYIERQQSSWAVANEQVQDKPIGKPQSFKINASKMSETKPTANQSTNGRAPGN